MIKTNNLFAISVAFVVLVLLQFIVDHLFEHWLPEISIDADMFTEMRALSLDMPLEFPESDISTTHTGNSANLMFLYMGISMFFIVCVAAYITARLAKQAKMLSAIVTGIIYWVLMLFNGEIYMLAQFPVILTGLVFLTLFAVVLGGFIDNKVRSGAIGSLRVRD